MSPTSVAGALQGRCWGAAEAKTQQLKRLEALQERPVAQALAGEESATWQECKRTPEARGPGTPTLV